MIQKCKPILYVVVQAQLLGGYLINNSHVICQNQGIKLDASNIMGYILETNCEFKILHF